MTKGEGLLRVNNTDSRAGVVEGKRAIQETLGTYRIKHLLDYIKGGGGEKKEEPSAFRGGGKISVFSYWLRSLAGREK